MFDQVGSIPSTIEQTNIKKAQNRSFVKVKPKQTLSHPSNHDFVRGKKRKPANKGPKPQTTARLIVVIKRTPNAEHVRNKAAITNIEPKNPITTIFPKLKVFIHIKYDLRTSKSSTHNLSIAFHDESGVPGIVFKMRCSAESKKSQL